MNNKNQTTTRPLKGSVRVAGTRGSQMNTPAGTGVDRALHKDPAARHRQETDVILHEQDDGGEPGSGPDGYLRTRGIVHRAMELLTEWKFHPARISSSKVPVDIIAIRQDMALLVQVISSKKPIPDAKTLVRNYAARIDALRQMGTQIQFRRMLMAHSKLCGWKYYEVLPGGLIPAWHLPEVPAA